MGHDPGVITSSFPGRVCLLGEHCDWAGGSSLAVPLPLAVEVTARSGKGSADVTMDTSVEGERLRGRWPAAGVSDPEGGPLRFVGAALETLHQAGRHVPPTELLVRSDLPTGRGFSSSAAFTLAVLDALTRRASTPMSGAELAAAALETERDRLGVPCGLLDPLACATRAPVLIEWGRGPGDEYRLEIIEPGRSLDLVVGSFREPRDTQGILRALNDDFAQPGSASEEAFAHFALGAIEAGAALAQGDPSTLGQAMDSAQAVYESHLEARLPALAAPRLRACCAWFRDQGALGAKFSGAGGDGSVVALYANRAEATGALRDFQDTFAVDAWHVSIPAPGL